MFRKGPHQIRPVALRKHCRSTCQQNGFASERFDSNAQLREKFLCLKNGSRLARREIDRFLRRYDADVHVVAEFDNIENIKQAIEDGAGIAILPEPALRREVQTGALVKIPIRQNPDAAAFVRPISLVHRRKRRLHPAVMEFVNLLLAESVDGVLGSDRSPETHKIGAAV